MGIVSLLYIVRDLTGPCYILLTVTPLDCFYNKQYCLNVSCIFMHPSIHFNLSFCLQCSYLTPSQINPCAPSNTLLKTLPTLVPSPAHPWTNLITSPSIVSTAFGTDVYYMPGTVLDVGTRVISKTLDSLVLTLYFGRQTVGK